jgi:hypothetical protein
MGNEVMTATLESVLGAAHFTAIPESQLRNPFAHTRTVTDSPFEVPDPKWREVIDNFLAARSLRDDWDGQGAKAPTIDVVDTSLQLAVKLRQLGISPPDDFGVGINGTITIAWRTPEWSVEVEVCSPVRIEGFRWRRGAEQAEQVVFSTEV